MKKKYILLIILLISFFVLCFEIDRARSVAKKYLPQKTKTLVKEFIFGEQTIEDIKQLRKYALMNYNQKLLPETQFININFKKILLKNLKLKGVGHYNKLFRGSKIQTWNLNDLKP